MKEILCFGDSNTWGFNAQTKDRFPRDVRWTGILKKELGDEYYVIEEGLNGRTTVWDDPIEMDKNGYRHLGTCLQSHKPLDLVILMLGTNDLKIRFSVSAEDIADSVQALGNMVLKSECGPEGKAPKLLLISPIAVGNIDNSEFVHMFGVNSALRAAKFPLLYRQAAESLKCDFLNAAEFAKPSPFDAIHFDAEEHERLGKAIADKVKSILY